jgi:hypothetical protein
MQYEYTVLKSVIYETTVVAEDYDDAIEKAYALDFWTEIAIETEVTDVEPITKEPHNAND